METTPASALRKPPTIRAMQQSRFLRRYFGRMMHALHLALDYVTVLGAYLGAYYFYVSVLERVSPQDFQQFLTVSASVALLYVLIMDRVGLYSPESGLLNITELRGIFRVSIYAAAAVLAATFYFRSVTFSRITLTTAMVATPFFLILQRSLFYRLHVLFHQNGWSTKRVLIFGAGNIGTQLARRLFASPSLGMVPVGFLDDDESLHGSEIPLKGEHGKQIRLSVIGGEKSLDHFDEFDVDALMIAAPSATFERNQKLVERCMAEGIEYSIVPNSYERFVQVVEMFEIGGIPVLKHRNFRAGFFYLLTKRIADFILSAIFMILLSPAWLVIAVMIKLDSPGPVIFKQKRTGLKGREFSFYKLRTMKMESPQYTTSPRSYEDGRITKLGRWLRRTSLDELPQLFNVFRGDMSLVGPRPEMPFIVEKYSPLERLRLEAKPGITGVWQISANRGDPIHLNLEYDLYYLANRSTLLDFSIIVKTIWSVVKGVGAV